MNTIARLKEVSEAVNKFNLGVAQDDQQLDLEANLAHQEYLMAERPCDAHRASIKRENIVVRKGVREVAKKRRYKH